MLYEVIVLQCTSLISVHNKFEIPVKQFNFSKAATLKLCLIFFNCNFMNVDLSKTFKSGRYFMVFVKEPILINRVLTLHGILHFCRRFSCGTSITYLIAA